MKKPVLGELSFPDELGASDAVQMVRWIVDQKGFFDGQVLIFFFVHITGVLRTTKQRNFLFK